MRDVPAKAPRSPTARRRIGAAASLTCLLITSACVIKPPPNATEIQDQSLFFGPTPTAWTAPGATAGPVSAGWLETFHDATLEKLVSEALAFNGDLQVAATRMERAAGYAKAAGAAIFPAVNLLARDGGQLSGDNSGLQGAVASASWELDLWGRVRAGRASAAMQYASAESDYAYARQSVAALVAKSWFLAIEAHRQMSIASDMVQSAEQLVTLARERQQVGAGNEYDVVVADANLASMRDALHSLQLGYTQALRALEVILGRYPSATLTTDTALPDLPPPVPAGLPSELLERRPDIIAAERRVAAAFHSVEEAKAAMLPKISLTTGVSSISSDLFVLQDRDNPAWSAGASLLAPIYQGGALRAQVDIRTAEQKTALAEYARAGLHAFGDVENALSSEFTLAAREKILAQAVIDNTRAVELAETRYRVGTSDLRAVSHQQLALFSSRATLLRVKSEALVQRVNLYLALGGGFSQ